jgi:hypothetical protein
VDLLIPAGLPRPAFVYLSNAEGSGKTLLIRLALCPVYGSLEIKAPPDMRNGGDEMRKVLTTEAVSGSPYICFDNFKTNTIIESPALESFLTASKISDRWLGKMEKVTADRDALVFLSGNNCRTGADIRRRSLFVEMFSDVVETEKRAVQNFMSEIDIVRMRGKILSALWSLVEHWITEGRPSSSVHNGSYREWGHMVGGIVECLGLLSPLNEVKLDRGGDTDLEDMEVLLSMVWEDGPSEEDDIQRLPCGGLSVKSGTLLDRARVAGLFTQFVSEDEPSGSGLAKQRAIWGKVLFRFTGRTMRSGIKFLKTSHESRANRRYLLQK